MAKKTAIALVAATGVAPKSTQKQLPAIPCALKYFWQYALLAWAYCRENIDLFAAERPYFTKEFINDEETFIKTTKELPNNTTRRSLSREVLLALKASRQTIFDEGQRLGLAIDFAYREDPKEVAEVQRTIAGLFDLSAASPSNWGAVSSFITTAKGYLAANNATLVAAGAINEGFTENFARVGDAFDRLWNDVLLMRKSAKEGTKDVADGIERIKLQLDPMLKLGSETIFKYDPAKRQLFTMDSLVAEVRSTHPAGVKGRTDWADTERPIAGLLVEIVDVPDKSAVTDSKGRYEIKQLAAGDYTLRFTGDNILPVLKTVTLSAGVNRRLNVLFEPIPVEEIMLPRIVHQTLPSTEEMEAALHDGAAPTNGTTTMPHQNGVAVA